MSGGIDWLPAVPGSQHNEWRYNGKVCTVIAMGVRQGLTVPCAIRVMTWDGKIIDEMVGPDGRWANVGYRKKQA